MRNNNAEKKHYFCTSVLIEQGIQLLLVDIWCGRDKCHVPLWVCKVRFNRLFDPLAILLQQAQGYCVGKASDCRHLMNLFTFSLALALSRSLITMILQYVRRGDFNKKRANRCLHCVSQKITGGKETSYHDFLDEKLTGPYEIQ